MPGKSRLRRKLVKKKQRQRRRQKQAQERDKQRTEDEALPDYQLWLKQQTELEDFQLLASQRQQQDEEEAWLRREALAQRQFRLEAARRRQEQDELDRVRQQQHMELAARQAEQRKRQEEREKLAAQAAADFEALMQSMDDYLNNQAQQTPPAELRRMLDTHPEQRLCEFFTRTNCCRYGHSCTYNHRRPLLARILLIRHFFSHPLLANRVHPEYASAEEHLELTEEDLRQDYNEFFSDAIGELEKFGKILNFRAVRNTLDHLRGHVFVEYAEERFALRAFINLQGRYYASRRLNVEFSNLVTWRGAVCGT